VSLLALGKNPKFSFVTTENKCMIFVCEGVTGTDATVGHTVKSGLDWDKKSARAF